MNLNCRVVQKANGNKACDNCKFRYDCYTATEFAFETDCECSACDGTGIYIGIAEHDGAGVVCNKCKGTGKTHIEVTWSDFRGLQIKETVKRVYQTNPGVDIGIGAKVFKLEDFGGMNYSSWLKKPKFPAKSEMREFTCPAWWYQGVNYKLKPVWNTCHIAGHFSDCEQFSMKAQCWERWDEEYGSR